MSLINLSYMKSLTTMLYILSILINGIDSKSSKEISDNTFIINDIK